MHRYPGPCGPSKNIVEKVALALVDSDNDEIVHYTGAMLLLLQQTRSGGEHGRQHKKYWSEYCDQLIGSVHYLLNVLFVNYEEIYDNEHKEQAQLKLPELKLTDQPISRNVAVTQRLLNVLKCLKMAIVGPYPVAKMIKIESLLELINRATVVNSKMIAKNAILDNLIVAALLPQVHIGFLELLNTLVTTLKLHLREYCTEINKILLTSLQWTSSGVSGGQKKPLVNLRIAIYQSLQLWVEVMGRSSLLEKFGEKIITAVIDDSTPYRSEITLQVNMGSTKNLSKRAKKKLIKERNEATNLAQSHASGTQTAKVANQVLTDESNRDLCYAALSALNAVLEFVGTWIEAELHLALQQHLVRLGVQVLDMQPDQRHLYYTAQCRSALYNVLASICTNSHGLAPPPLQYVINVLSKARNNDDSALVRDTCTRRLGELELILQPVRESIFPEIDSDLVADVVRNAKRRVQEVEPAGDDSSEAEENDGFNGTVVLIDDDDDVKMVVDKPPTPPPLLLPINGNHTKPEETFLSGLTSIKFTAVPSAGSAAKKFLMETGTGESRFVTQSSVFDCRHHGDAAESAEDEENSESENSADSTDMVRGSDESDDDEDEDSEDDHCTDLDEEIEELLQKRQLQYSESIYEQYNRNSGGDRGERRQLNEAKIAKVAKAVESAQLRDDDIVVTDEDKLVDEMVGDFVAD